MSDAGWTVIEPLQPPPAILGASRFRRRDRVTDRSNSAFKGSGHSRRRARPIAAAVGTRHGFSYCRTRSSPLRQEPGHLSIALPGEQAHHECTR